MKKIESLLKVVDFAMYDPLNVLECTGVMGLTKVWMILFEGCLELQ